MTIVHDEYQNELVLPREEQIPSDVFRKGEPVRALVKDVEIRGAKPNVILSRVDPLFLERLFEAEIPEIADGLIMIKKVVRIPGEKAKVAVESYDDRIDPVGACVGMKGSRIHGIVRELGGENIDVINYTTNLQLMVSRCLSPAKLTSIEVDEQAHRISVYVKPDEVSKAIGKQGQNIRLASQMVGYEIDIYRDTPEEDVDLKEFADEIEDWVIEEFQRVGCDTAKSVLELGKEELLRRTDLEEETVDHVLEVLSKEFEN